MPKRPARKTGYHHGDLRNALLQAGTRLLRHAGLDALSLRRVAKEAKVSPAAPYRHFPDKHALLAAISEHGFRTLHARLEAARAASPGDLDASGQAYLAFALAEPETYRLMFTQNVLCAGEPPESLQEAGRQAFESLVATIAEGQASGRIAARDGAQLALGAWALVHGVAMLIIDGALDREPYNQLPPGHLLAACQAIFREGWRNLP
jgi:AcrR family transcriptional regulator